MYLRRYLRRYIYLCMYTVQPPGFNHPTVHYIHHVGCSCQNWYAYLVKPHARGICCCIFLLQRGSLYTSSKHHLHFVRRRVHTCSVCTNRYVSYMNCALLYSETRDLFDDSELSTVNILFFSPLPFSASFLNTFRMNRS